MDNVCKLLTELSTDPFRRAGALCDLDEALEGSGVSEHELSTALRADSRQIANGSWATCATCSDPGSDPYPEDGD